MLPGFALNRYTVGRFNALYFHKQMQEPRVNTAGLRTVLLSARRRPQWNRMYGKRGLLQFQYVIPWEHAREGTIAIMHEVAKSGLASFLAVLKAFGDVPCPA